MKRYHFLQADAARIPLADDSVQLVFASPPYEMARLYLENGKDLGIARKTEAWVAWMVEVTKEALRVCNGLVCWVVEGQTRNFSYSGAPMLLAADLIRAGITIRKPCIYHRIGIPGSGGPDWVRNDWEPVICCTRGGKLSWSDNTACGHVPKWGPGGEMSHRNPEGSRVNQWGHRQGKDGIRTGKERQQDGSMTKRSRPSHKFTKTTTRGHAADGQTILGEYSPPVLANPGNSIEQMYSASEVQAMLKQFGDIVDSQVGGGLMGHDLSHENEAPFPLDLPDFFIRSFCPPAGKVLDCFSGSGTTVHAAIEAGRIGIGMDLRPSQCDLGRRRLETVTPALFA